MTPTTQALEWIVNAHLEVARLYRLAIEREIQAVLRIFNGTLLDDTKTVLKQSIKEIAVPTYPTYDGQENISGLWDKAPKPNFVKIRLEYLSLVDSL